MTNYDLLWAREWAGLTQAQAAAKMGVHRDTFSRWETGARPMPVRKWQLFLKLVAVNPLEIPKRPEPLRYDACGYPVGFPADSFWNADGSDYDFDAHDAALEKMEGDEYAARTRERYRLCRTKCMPEEAAARYMAEYDEEERRLARGLPHRSDEEIHPGDYRSAEARAREEERMRAWKQNPEGMAAEVRARVAGYPIHQRSEPADVDRVIRELQERARAWILPEDLV